MRSYWAFFARGNGGPNGSLQPSSAADIPQWPRYTGGKVGNDWLRLEVRSKGGPSLSPGWLDTFCDFWDSAGYGHYQQTTRVARDYRSRCWAAPCGCAVTRTRSRGTAAPGCVLRRAKAPSFVLEHALCSLAWHTIGIWLEPLEAESGPPNSKGSVSIRPALQISRALTDLHFPTTRGGSPVS